MFATRDFLNTARPPIKPTVHDTRLADVIENESLVRVLCDKLNRLWQLVFLDENILGEFKVAKPCHSCVEITTENKVVIRFVLNDVAETHECRAGRKLLQERPHVRAAQR